MRSDTKSKILKCVGITAAFWGLFFFGGLLMALLNSAMMLMTDSGLTRKAIGFFSQTISCIMACETAEMISAKKYNICVFVNELLSLCVLILFILGTGLVMKDVFSVLCNALATVVTIVYMVRSAKAIVRNEQY